MSNYSTHYQNIVRNCKDKSTDKCWINSQPCSFCTESSLFKFCSESPHEVAKVICDAWKDVYVPIVGSEHYKSIWAGDLFWAQNVALYLGKGNPNRKELKMLGPEAYAIVRDLTGCWRAHKKPTTINVADIMEVFEGSQHDKRCAEREGLE